MYIEYLNYISFNQPWFLLLLFQPVIMLFMLKSKEFMLSLYADKKLWPWVIKVPNKSEYIWQKIIYIIAWSLFVVALSGPRIPIISEISNTHNTLRHDVSIILLINLNSIIRNYDKKTIVSISDFIKTLKGERVGIIAVSSDYGLVSPLTSDYEALKFYAKQTFSVIDTKKVNVAQKLNSAFNAAEHILSSSNATSSAIIYMSGNGNINLAANEIKKLNEIFQRIQNKNVKLLPVFQNPGFSNDSNTISSIISNSGSPENIDIKNLTVDNIYEKVIGELPATFTLESEYKNTKELFSYFLILGFILYFISSIPLRNLF